MLRYDLDKLGWYSFECLCQTLLKHKLGLGVEAWGGHKDWGRDSYYEGQLNYPKKEPQEGPFIFQCKFVNGANAAGARNDDLILNSVKQECKSIQSKLQDKIHEVSKRVTEREWKIPPKIYTFMSNAIIRPPLRKSIEDCVKEVLPDCKFVKNDGKDICGTIDLTDGIAKKFPAILSLNDLESLLSNCVNNDLLVRSNAAIEEAKEISKVFVPTKSYAKAFNILNKFYYVVLEGPPEVGKTAIGRMIALSYIPENWEAIECREPRDFLRKYKEADKQIFVADDSFGRTEYRPDRVRLWQDELPSILRKIDKHHLLILTSRKHLLEMAKDKLDIPGVNCIFPLPAEVLVDVSSLTELNKTLMLYRHMKNAGLDEKQKKSVCKLAKFTIAHKGFTPERIRELTQKVKASGMNSKLVNEMLQNPTGRMSKTYRGLPVAHKWFMISVLLSSPNHFSNSKNIESLYEELCPSGEMREFAEIKSHLSEAFIKTVPFWITDDYGNPNFESLTDIICWVHPSCGDMVAKELSNSPKDRIHFLKHCNVSGLKYAVSVGGGSEGSEVLPILKSRKDWSIFEERCIENLSLTLIKNMFDSIQQLAKENKYRKKQQLLENVIKIIIIKAVDEFNAKNWSNAWLIAVLNIKVQLDIETANVNYEEAWFIEADYVMELLEGEYIDWDVSGFDEFIVLTDAIVGHNSCFLEDKNVKEKWEKVLNVFQQRGEEESSTSGFDVSTDEAEKLYDHSDSLNKLYERISIMMEQEKQNDKFIKISENFAVFMDEVSNFLPYEPDYDRDDDMLYDRSEDFSIDQVFEDL
ncbi:hypothetical protein KAR91_36060 [Candidatus Pacearchaeota archaeon]|nr:hypothetical protein [Candidatus Pacearchaeota archaeon]